jgi:hypothetical protein
VKQKKPAILDLGKSWLSLVPFCNWHSLAWDLFSKIDSSFEYIGVIRKRTIYSEALRKNRLI